VTNTLSDPQKPATLKQRFHEEMRLRNNSLRTEDGYWAVIRKFVVVTGAKCCCDLLVNSTQKVRDFLTALALRDVAASTQSVAFSALLFLYREVLKENFGELGSIPRAKRKRRLPDIVMHEDATALIARLSGDTRLVAQLLYGTGMRVSEALRLRTKDIDFKRGTITIHEGKGDKDRRVMLPKSLRANLQAKIAATLDLHASDFAAGFGEVMLPHSLAKKYPKASRDPQWQFLFPARTRSIDPKDRREKRHHLSPAAVQKAFALAGHLRPHSLRHAFAARLFEAGHELHTIQRQLGHSGIVTTLGYLDTFKPEAPGVVSPLDIC
jgi:integron integrase